MLQSASHRSPLRSNRVRDKKVDERGNAPIRSRERKRAVAGRARRIHFQDRGSGHIVLVVDGAGFAAVQVASVTDEGDRANHLTYSYARILLIGRCFHESLTSASRTRSNPAFSSVLL